MMARMTRTTRFVSPSSLFRVILSYYYHTTSGKMMNKKERQTYPSSGGETRHELICLVEDIRTECMQNYCARKTDDFQSVQVIAGSLFLSECIIYERHIISRKHRKLCFESPLIDTWVRSITRVALSIAITFRGCLA